MAESIEKGQNDAVSMRELLDQGYTFNRPKRGDILEAEVVRVGEGEIIVNIGTKTEGVVPSQDLETLSEEVRSGLEVGTRVPVYVLQPETPEGAVVVSVKMAQTVEDWRRAEKHLQEGEIFEGTVTGLNKGGLIVPFGQIRGFVPVSQLVDFSEGRGESRMERLAAIEGASLELKVIEVNRKRQRLIFSQRAAMREVREKRKETLLEELREGDIRTGRVSGLCNFGAFVDLGGADGLIHVSELSWRKNQRPSELLKIGDEVEVYVLRVDREKKRIGLSLRRLQPDPWSLVEEQFQVGQVVEGTITNVVNFGAFARMDEGIEGLIHLSELSDDTSLDPRQIVKKGDVVPLKILSIDVTRKRMGLSLKRAPSREELEGLEAMSEMKENQTPQSEA